MDAKGRYSTAFHVADRNRKSLAAHRSHESAGWREATGTVFSICRTDEANTY